MLRYPRGGTNHPRDIQIGTGFTRVLGPSMYRRRLAPTQGQQTRPTLPCRQGPTHQAHL